MKTMKEFWDEYKTAYKGAILLFKLGEDYEVFYDDAHLTARICGTPYNHGRAVISECSLSWVIEKLQTAGHEVQIITEREP